jgi:hypothetical protein
MSPRETEYHSKRHETTLKNLPSSKSDFSSRGRESHLSRYHRGAAQIAGYKQRVLAGWLRSTALDQVPACRS